VHRKVIDPAKVKRIVRWFDALPISPPGVSALCGVAPGAGVTITLSFRSAGGRRLARAQLPATLAGICDGLTFTIGGHRQTPLIDNYYRRAPFPHSFVARLQRLLGVQLIVRS
jgi:hypothetical protein